MKATDAAVDRTVLSHLYFEEEDKILGVLDTCFQDGGWYVASLIYDEILVERREGIHAMMRKAEVAVRQNLGYDIGLKLEEALSHP